ncbi:MAG: hypothetical protein WBE81_28120, partial [Pseudolabrys sp.]
FEASSPPGESRGGLSFSADRLSKKSGPPQRKIQTVFKVAAGQHAICRASLQFRPGVLVFA